MSVYTDDPLLQLASAHRYVKSSAFEGPHNPVNDRRHAAPPGTEGPWDATGAMGADGMKPTTVTKLDISKYY